VMGGKKKYIELFGSFTEPFKCLFVKTCSICLLVIKVAFDQISLSLCFNGHFSWWTWLALAGFIGAAKDDGSGSDNWSYKMCKIQLTAKNTQLLTGWMPFMSPTLLVGCQSMKGNVHTLAHPKLTWGLPAVSLTIKGSWLPWRKVVMPLISILIPEPHCLRSNNKTNMD